MTHLSLLRIMGSPFIRGAAVAALIPALLEAQPPGDPVLPDPTEPFSLAQSATASEGALFLLLPIGAQGVGLARAMTAMPTSESAFWNPAGLAHLERSRIVLYRGDHVAGDATGFSAIMGRWEPVTLALSYGLLDSGTQHLTDETGEVLGSISIRGHHALLSGASALRDWLDAGLSLKVVQFRQSCRGQCPDAGVRASSYAVDFGMQLRPIEERPLRIGVMVAHLGRPLRIDDVDQSDPLPSRVRVAAAYSFFGEVIEETLELQLLGEVEDRLREPGDPALFLGAEFSAGTEDRIYLRAGYIFGSRNDTDGAAVGLGLQYERFELGIARSLARGGPALEQEPVHFTVGLSF